MENKLTASELDGVSFFDEVPCYISIQDRSCRVLRANRKMREDFGAPASMPCYAMFKGRKEQCPECIVEHTYEDGREHESAGVIFDRRGLPHDVLVKTRPLRGPSGEIVAVMQMFTDIAVQKELEHRLHDSLTRFHNLFDLAPCFIALQDRELRILEANDRFQASFGSPLGRFCYQVYKGRREPCSGCPVARTFADGETHTGEHALTDSTGKQVDLVVYTAPLRNARGDITEVMSVSADITEIRALEDKLASLGRLVGGIAHSVKNVLEGLRGGVYIVNLGFRDNNQEDIRTGWDMVQRNVARVSSMIMDMLYCARDRSPRRLPVSLAGVAKEVVGLFSARAQDRGVQLETQVAEDAGTVLGEPRDIHSLLANLVTNAIDACSSDQDAEKTGRVLIRIRREKGEAVIEVEDNGIGMDEETRGKLFTTFFSTKGTFGTGLGLLVAHKVATEHGGTIGVRSAAGEGSTFTVKLPSNQEQ